MTINGSQVVTPGGKTIIGRYTRHHFDYVIPQGEENAGNRVSADQIDDQNIQVTEGRHTADPPNAHVIWKRCEVVS